MDCSLRLLLERSWWLSSLWLEVTREPLSRDTGSLGVKDTTWINQCPKYMTWRIALQCSVLIEFRFVEPIYSVYSSTLIILLSYQITNAKRARIRRTLNMRRLTISSWLQRSRMGISRGDLTNKDCHILPHTNAAFDFFLHLAPLKLNAVSEKFTSV